jgi:hypothetical protein
MLQLVLHWSEPLEPMLLRCEKTSMESGFCPRFTERTESTSFALWNIFLELTALRMQFSQRAYASPLLYTPVVRIICEKICIELRK